jgi:hypothetical protein
MYTDHYSLEALVDQRHQEALHQAHERHLAKQLRAERKHRSQQSRVVGFVWASVLSLVHGALSSQ